MEIRVTDYDKRLEIDGIPDGTFQFVWDDVCSAPPSGEVWLLDRGEWYAIHDADCVHEAAIAAECWIQCANKDATTRNVEFELAYERALIEYHSNPIGCETV
jgi:hypothetical protein